MPSYLPPRKGVTFAEAYAEAAAIAPIGRPVLHFFELWHPTMTEPVRVVRNYEALTVKLEDDAPRNAGEEVEHLACFARVERPDESAEAAAPETRFSIDNVNGLLKRALDGARGSRELWEVIERVYTLDDTTAPAVLPVLKLTFTKATLKGGTATLTTGYGDPVNVSIPRLTFTPDEYPGLSSR